MANKFSLLQYSTAAAALLGVTAASSQVVYTDIDPDVVLDEPNEMFGIDLDDDGLNDFNFFNESFITTVFYGDLANVKALFVGAFDTILNGIAGSTGFLSGGGGYTYYWPYAMQNGVIIDENLNFFNSNYQSLVALKYKIDVPFVLPQGNWTSFYSGYEHLNEYVAIRFADEEAIMRYGWIRCSVVDSGRTLIIHDYAYELQPDQPIIAGDTVSFVNIQEQPSLFATVYNYNTTIYINLHNYTPTQLTIVNLTGQTILDKSIYNQFEIVDMNYFPKGIYLVTLKEGENILTRKVAIE
ncbi:MAG TPA: T9SS type A sorting domain-containing protein [Chitinophagales bacterium]|nr:T9SS type A sorting domain-containing protein [Chitinophagales bacterium]HMZ88474.1 T9SS type A sorting domain-containing protein [Chitinophagales bacterium]HNF70200.1 T9SS type A sorting domain-containing protein [Chitinophagales bacterium]HNJ90756.1 T9SS type A sorting domain-containing protein [Chitinophagales bacterium]HNK98889.1 T9SS type A sorting domain-containing protein [Chitinophagales bacterium]